MGCSLTLIVDSKLVLQHVVIKIEDHDARKRNEIVGLLIPKSIVSGNVFIALPILKKYVHTIEIVGLLIPKSIVSRGALHMLPILKGLRHMMQSIVMLIPKSIVSGTALHMLLIPKSIVKKRVNAAIYNPQPRPCSKPAQP